MSRTVQIVLLCEDKQQQAFMRRFLERSGKDCRLFRTETAPRGEGSAVQFVRKRFAKEVAEHRRRSVSQELMVRLARPKDCGAHAAALGEMCDRRRLREPAPPSLIAACVEYRRWLAARNR